MEITLASKSAIRRELLENAGIAFEAASAGVDEDALKVAMRAEGLSPRDQAMQLAEAKAVKVSLSRPGLVIGADQMLSIGSRTFDKPQSLKVAKERLLEWRGTSHYLETAIVIAEAGQPVWRHITRPELTVRNFSEQFLDQYIETAGEAILSSVGGYQLETIGVQLFSKIEGDYFSILGLPLLPLLDYLRTRDLVIT